MSAPLWFRRMWSASVARFRVTRSGYLFGAALAIVGVAAIASANNLLFLILAAMLATLLISGFVSRGGLAGLELELILPEHIAARQPVSARMRLRNVKWFPSFAIRLSGPQTLQREIVFPVLPGRSVLDAESPAVFPNRGLHQENLFSISTRFPFGFVERRARVAIRSEVVIYPALDGSLAAGELLGELRGELEQDRRGMGSDFYRLRPYDYQESARHLDWKSSAHTGELQVREFSSEERSLVYLYFDLAMPAGEGFERHIQTCAFLVWMLSREGAGVRFRTQSADLLYPDRCDAYELLRCLALLESDPLAVAPDADGDDPQVLFTASADAFAQQGWRAARVVG